MDGMKKQTLIIILMVLALMMASLACVDGGDGVSTARGFSADDATASAAAEEFHLQLTLQPSTVIVTPSP